MQLMAWGLEQVQGFPGPGTLSLLLPWPQGLAQCPQHQMLPLPHLVLEIELKTLLLLPGNLFLRQGLDSSAL